jgi:hypothetical protein
MPSLLYYLPSAFISSLSAVMNHSLHPLAFPCFFCLSRIFLTSVARCTLMLCLSHCKLFSYLPCCCWVEDLTQFPLCGCLIQHYAHNIQNAGLDKIFCNGLSFTWHCYCFFFSLHMEFSVTYLLEICIAWIIALFQLVNLRSKEYHIQGNQICMLTLNMSLYFGWPKQAVL